MYQFVGNVAKSILTLSGSKAKLYETQHIPNEGGFIIACTHNGYVDIINLGIALLPREIHFMAKKQLFDIKGLGWLIDNLNAFPVDRDHPGPSVIKVPRELLKQNKIVGIFPSGTRNAESSNLKQGAISIAQLTKAPILPAAYIGARNVGEVFKRNKGYLIFGEPFYVTSRGKEGREEFTHILEEKLESLTHDLEERVTKRKKKS
ncbi:1-acyl-sn-glycerol-3-phosphate acyltransferase [Lysinibacillus alkalisoli]|uniref:1-acyl-sn-glycerol-3-phosphate acyltransferase n=1 Tax=Lysinibacillus alkalisoli TaxID=1911548 RepID=A0A917G4W5_9BACI|nr:lysophospholipid acyltransferase family protein [Lysinibacillus alkalisoli]GGG22835.1 1-acyl-sn-glycerol-3-phosphate acyltransferase [Lysinibacillus alkalisoli]